MGSSALSVLESVLRTQSLSLCPRNSLKLSNFSSSSKFSYRNSSLLSFRNSINWYNARFSHSLLTSTTPNGMEFRLPHPHCKSDFDVLEKSLANKNSTRENLNAAPYVSYGALLKFMMLFGYLTIQGSQPAVAALDLSSAMQSISYLGDFGDIKTGFASAFLLIFFSELGDKTFFIAALLAARNSAIVVFLGTFGALGAMTIISVFLGRTFHYVDEILPFRFGETDLPVDDIAAVCLLVYFGVSTLIDATSGDSLKADEEQKEAELAVSDFSGNGAGILAAASTIISTFLLVFVAEWGDKSFFSTIALAAASSPLGVIGGALAGHGAATLLAVLGGSLLGTFLSEKVIAYVGGSLFLVFALVTLIEIVT